MRKGLIAVGALATAGIVPAMWTPAAVADPVIPIVTLAQTPPLAEQAGARVAWNLSPVLDQVAVEPVTVTLTVLGGTAELGTDFLLPPTLDLTGTDRGDLEIEVLDDDIPEPDETLDVLITVTGSTILDGIDVQLRTLTIWDNEGEGTGVALIEESPISGNGFLEGNTGATNQAVVRLRTQSIRPVGDYTATFQIVGASGVISLGENETFTVGCTDCAGEVVNFDVGATIIGDELREPAESVFFVNLIAVTGDLTIDPDRSSVRIVIIDDDTPLGVAIGTNLLDDSDQLVPLITTEGIATDVTFTGGTEVASDAEIVTMELVSGTTSLADFALTDFTATCVRPIVDDANCTATNQLLPLWDSAVEGTETATLVATAKPGYVFANGETVLNVPVQVTDGGAELKIARRQATAPEGDSGITTVWFDVTLSAPQSELVEIAYATSDGSAINPDDYTARTSSVIIPAGQVAAEIGLGVNGDLKVESDESFFVNASVERGPSDLTFITPAHEVIIDDDDVYPTASAASARVAERSQGQWALSTVITLNNTPLEPVTVEYATQAITATLGVDFLETVGTATFGVGQTLYTVNIPIIGDVLPEAAETFNLELANAVGAVIDPTPGTITIEDDDSLELAASVADLVVDENAATANVEISLSSVPSSSVTLEYSTAGGSATAGRDFRSKSGTLVFARGVQSQTVPVRIIDDSREESLEQFTLTIRNVNGAVASQSPTGTIDIIDDDSPTPNVRATMLPLTIVEGDGTGGSAQATVTLSEPRTKVTNIELRSQSSTAEEGIDFPQVATTLTIPAGETTGSVAISVLPDEIVEINETFRLMLEVTNDPRLRIQNANVAVTIVDDDAALVSIRQIDVEPVLERSSGTRTVRYVISVPPGSLAHDVIVAVATQSGTASSRTDYYPLSTRVTFGPNVTEQEVSVRVRGDLEVEQDETFSIEVSSRDSGLTMPEPFVTTIVNDD